MMIVPENMDIVSISASIVRRFQQIKKSPSLGICLEKLMWIEISRHESAQKLAEYRRKIREYRIEEVGE